MGVSVYRAEEQNEFFIKGADMQAIDTAHKKPPARATIPAEEKVLVAVLMAVRFLDLNPHR
jgi:hypothetical protein